MIRLIIIFLTENSTLFFNVLKKFKFIEAIVIGEKVKVAPQLLQILFFSFCLLSLTNVGASSFHFPLSQFLPAWGLHNFHHPLHFYYPLTRYFS